MVNDKSEIKYKSLFSYSGLVTEILSFKISLMGPISIKTVVIKVQKYS